MHGETFEDRLKAREAKGSTKATPEIKAKIVESGRWYRTEPDVIVKFFERMKYKLYRLLEIRYGAVTACPLLVVFSPNKNGAAVRAQTSAVG